MSVDTTFLPKTNGMVFSDRLLMRSDKGRVFGLGTTYIPLEIVDPAEWKDDNVYEFGQTIQGRTATFTGGSENATYRSRMQFRKTKDYSWEAVGDWTYHDNEHIYVDVPVTRCGQIRFMTRADDNEGLFRVNDKVQSNSPPQTVPFLSFGAITGSINAADYDIFASPPNEVGTGFYVNLAVNTDGNASPTYRWSSRSGSSVEIVNPTDRTTQVKCTSDGMHTITCAIEDQNTEEGSISATFTLISTL